MQDRDLVEKIKDGDFQAFKNLFESHHPEVLNLCFKLIGNKVEAEDVCQEVFVKIYRSIHSFKYKSRLSTWIYRIAVNQCLNHQRKKKRVRFFQLDDKEEENRGELQEALINPMHDQPDISLEKKEREKIILDLVNSLPENQRVVMILQRYEGMTCEEIAQVLNASVSSVQSRIYRAKENLAKKIVPFLDKI